MSMSSPAPSDLSRTELETVVNWPLLAGAAGLVVVLAAVLIGMAFRSALKRDVEQVPIAARPAPPPAVDVAPVAAPIRPVASFEAKEVVTPLPVYREAARPSLPVPVTKPAPAVAIAPRPLDPVLQIDDLPPPPPSPKRRNLLSEDSLYEDLQRHTRQVDLEAEKGTTADLLKEMKETEGVPAARRAKPKPRAASAERPRVKARSSEDAVDESPVFALLAKRPDLRGLPMRRGAECRVSQETAQKMKELAVHIRSMPRGKPSLYSHQDLTAVEKIAGAVREETLSTAMQLLQVEPPVARRSLTKLLSDTTGRVSTSLLARQALFDPSFEVRQDAIEALKKRPADDYRPILLDGLRYPWAPVADHAAEALAELRDDDAVFDLVALLDEPDPCAPTRCKDDKWVVREVVRINHFRNCLLCHAPSSSGEDDLRGLIPTPGKPLPRVAYYGSQRGYFVRADVTYLRQDFSLMERVAKHGEWPQWQRFDYLVRTREMTRDELAAYAKKAPRADRSHYPQKDAVLFALRELTGLTAGESSADWYDVLCSSQEGNRP
jgi:hypothetical protein